ncbi:hypothetical protein AH04_24 [Erwinia phage AH04]|uniref:Uncharacterized protein n=1 Tax=Erwinia phage AH04 TaxID=2869569 RepID=A0AAE7X0M7_9CAUD|nr:hypothetical protein PQC02_gp290 [Erwinia phage AH04]QZA70511.1 hypothetical protein AH04_24 [Erwinia phage AH04]
MNIETVRTEFTDLLIDHFDVQSVKSYIVDPTMLRNMGESRYNKVIGIEIIINRTMRLHIFGSERQGKMLFTRPKEGIDKYIIGELRSYDFYFCLSDKHPSHRNLVARIIDIWLGHLAAENIRSTLSFYLKESGNVLDYCFGYKVLCTQRDTKTYDAVFDVLVNKNGRYHTYRGTFTNGNLSAITDEDNVSVPPEKMFEV